MCDYSLHNVASRPATVGDVLITTKFPNTITVGFASVGEPRVAVCLRPGTELAFDREPEYWRPLARWLRRRVAGTVARFRQVNPGRSDMHRDALEFPDGTIQLLTRLCPGQRATVLQLPADAHTTSVPNEEGNPRHAGQERSLLLT